MPIFVLTRTEPEHAIQGLARFVTDLESAVALAKDAAGDRNVMMHGASSVQALLRVGLVDELVFHLVPILRGRGKRLFDKGPAEASRLRLIRSVEGAGVLHLRYEVQRPAKRTAAAST